MRAYRDSTISRWYVKGKSDLSQQGTPPNRQQTGNAYCMCGDFGPNNGRCDVCGYTFTIFRKPKPPGVKINDGGLIRDREYDPLRLEGRLSGWCYCGKIGIVGNECKRCHYEFTNDPNLLTREYDPLEKREKTGEIHRIAHSSEENSRDKGNSRLQNSLIAGEKDQAYLRGYSNWQLKYGSSSREHLASRIFSVVVICAMVLVVILVATSVSQ